MNRARLFILGMGFGLAVPLAASAQTAYTVRTVNMRAGPNVEYPLVVKIPAGVPVEVGGCVDGWSWCDVAVGPDRGWVSAAYLEYPYQDRRVVIYESGPVIGLPIVPFALGTYWGAYYAGRPWYGRRGYWEGRHLVVVAPAHPHTVAAHPHPNAAHPHTAEAHAHTHTVHPEAHPHTAAPHAAAPAPHAKAPAPHAKAPHGG